MKVPIIIDEPTGAARSQDLLSGGVPVARGELTEGGWFRMTADNGREYVVYGDPLAWWPDHSVKWLHVCGGVDLEGGVRNEFCLEPADAVPNDSLMVNTDGRFVNVRGGVLEVTVEASVLTMLSASFAAGDKAALLRPPGLSTHLVIIGPDGADRRQTSFELEPAQVPQVIVDTPNRVVVRLTGRYYVPGGREVGQLRLFIEIFRGRPEIRLEPVFIYTGIPNEDLIDTFTFTVHSAVDAVNGEYVFGNEQGRGFHDEVQRYKYGPRWPLARQLQLGSSFYRTEKRTCREAGWVKALEGSRAQGWCGLSGQDGAVTAAMRYFWEEYPHSLEIDADAGTLSFGLRPEAAEPLDLRRYSPTLYGEGESDEAMYESGRGPFRLRTHGATGIAKAHELAVIFHRQEEHDQVERALSFLYPCRLQTTPEHFAATKVIGVVAPANPPTHAKAEEVIAQVADFMMAEREVRGWYGLMDFGDMLMSFYSERDRWAFDEGGYAWINTEHVPDYGLWLSALRSARGDWLEGAIAMSRHNRDVDTYHEGGLKGLGTRHNVNHWGCGDKEWRISMPLSLRLHYFVTGDPWSAEVIRESTAVYQSYERTVKIAPRVTSPLVGIVAKWEMSGDPQDGDVVRNMADLFARAVREDGEFTADLHCNLATGEGHPVGDEPFASHFFMDEFGGQHILVELAELLDHKPLIEALGRRACRLSQQAGANKRDLSWVHGAFYGLACRSSGKQHYREVRKSLDALEFVTEAVGGPGILEELPHAIVPGLTRRNKYLCWLAGILSLVPYALTILAEETKSPIQNSESRIQNPESRMEDERPREPDSE